jgi:hypothetical protein
MEWTDNTTRDLTQQLESVQIIDKMYHERREEERVERVAIFHSSAPNG